MVSLGFVGKTTVQLVSDGNGTFKFCAYFFVYSREQRVTGAITFLFIGMSVSMTRILSHIPMPVLYGVFLYMGIAALGGIQLFDRMLLLFMPMK